MSVRGVPLFTAARRGTPLLFAQWVRRGAAQPILTTLVLLEEDRSATPDFRALWSRAFPSRPPLPFGPLANPDGTAADAFWFVFS